MSNNKIMFPFAKAIEWLILLQSNFIVSFTEAENKLMNKIYAE